MPLEQTITIVNNSGKIIGTVRPPRPSINCALAFHPSTAPHHLLTSDILLCNCPDRHSLTPRLQGKQLLSVFKEAKGAYQEKKAQIKTEKSTLNRAQTFDHYPTRSHRHFDPRDYDEYYEEDDDYYYKYHDERSRRRSVYDAPSETSSRRTARRSRSVHSKHPRHRDRDHGTSARSRAAPLTERNLKTHSEVSSTAPSRAPNYRSPYVETARDLAVSKMDLTHADMRSLAVSERRPPPTAMTRRQSMSEFSKSRRSSYDSQAHSPRHNHPKDVDMHLAYGDVPPDLEERVDLDPVLEEKVQEKRAKALVKKVEFILDEANCLKHSATSTISHLQKNPDAAAAVALTLAELSSVITKMSPAFLGFLKGGSPAVFALLASPQFLIGSAAVVGVTVVMFGGWKIVKKVKEAQAAREALAYQGVPMNRPAPMRTQSEFSTGMDEALIFDDELSSIETWRRGILPEFGENESADMELITPEADRATRLHGKDDFDLKSRKSTRTTKTTKTAKTSKSRKPADREVPERKSSKQATAESVAGSERSRKTSKKKEKAPLKAIEDGRSRRGDDVMDFVLRPKAQRQDNMLKALFKNKKEKDRELVHV